jgi:hypothetical protein
LTNDGDATAFCGVKLRFAEAVLSLYRYGAGVVERTHGLDVLR